MIRVKDFDLTASADGTVQQVSLTHPEDPGMRLWGYSFQVTGTFGSGTLELQVSNDGTNYVALPSGAKSLTAAGVKSTFDGELAGFKYARLQLSGSTSPSLTIKSMAEYLR